MKKNIFLLMAAMFLAVLPACTSNEADDDITSAEDAELKLFPSSTSYQFTAAGGEQSYTVTSNTTWSVESNQDWCSVAKDGDTKFVISADALTEVGVTVPEATITVTAGSGDNQAVASITVNQTEYKEQLTLAVEFSNTTYTGTDFTVTPSDDQAPYVVFNIPSYGYTDLSDDELLEVIVAIVNAAGESLDGVAKKGDYSYTNPNTDLPDTDYTVVAFGWEDNTVTSDMYREGYSTLASSASAESCTFTVTSSNVLTTSADINIEPSDEYITYAWVLYYSSDVDALDASELNSMMEEDIATQLSKYSISAMRQYGNFSENITGLPSSSDLSVVIVALDQTGTIVGDAKAYSWCTTATPQYAESYTKWLGTWTLTSTASYTFNVSNGQVTGTTDGGAISYDIIIAENVANESYYVYGWDISNARWAPGYGAPAIFDAETGTFTILGENFLGTDSQNYDIYVNATCSIDGMGKGYTVSGVYPALQGTLSDDAQSAEVLCGGGTVTDEAGTEYDFIANTVSVVAYKDKVAYGFGQDETLGLPDGVIGEGPYDLVKVSDSTVLPEMQSAMAKALGTGSATMKYLRQVNQKSFKYVAPVSNIKDIKPIEFAR